MIHSKKYSLNITDWLHGLLVASIGAGLTVLTASLNAGTMPDANILKASAVAALAGGGGYLLKKVFTNSDGKLQSEPKKDIQ